MRLIRGRDPWKEEVNYLDRLAETAPFGMFDDPAIVRDVDNLLEEIVRIAKEEFNITELDVEFYRTLYIGISTTREFMVTAFQHMTEQEVTTATVYHIKATLAALLHLSIRLVAKTHD